MKKIILLFGFSLLFFFACKKSEPSIGDDIVNDANKIELNLSFFDLKTDQYFPSKIKLGVADTMLIGTYIDELYGNMHSDFMLQYKAGNSFPNITSVDSISLDFYYKRASININTPQKFLIYQLNSSFNDADSTNTDPKKYIGDLIASTIVIPNSSYDAYYYYHSEFDSISCYKFSCSLDKSFADQFINADASAFANNDTFEELFHGLYVTLDNSIGCLFSIFDSEITFYYTENGEQKTYTLITNNQETKRLVMINNVNIKESIPDVDSVLMIKSPAGIFGEITFPISKIRETLNKGEGAFINNATLFFEMTNIENYNTTPYRPTFLMMVRESYATDYFENKRSINSKYAVMSNICTHIVNGDTIQGYEFQIATYINEMLIDETCDSVMIIAPVNYGDASSTFVKPTSSISSVILRNENNTKSPLKLRVYSSEFFKPED